GTGNYKLTLARAHGACSVSSSEEGWSTTNGWQHSGSLAGGDLDVWSFAASAGDNLVLRMGAANFNPSVRLYAPNGTLVGSAGSEIGRAACGDSVVTATNGGTFNVVSSSFTW